MKPTNTETIHHKYLPKLDLTEFIVQGINLAVVFYRESPDPDGAGTLVLERTNAHPTMSRFWYELVKVTEHVPGTMQNPPVRKSISPLDYQRLLASTVPA